MRPAMSPKRRFMTAFFGGTPDRIPVGNVVSAMTVDLMEAADAWFPKAHLDADVMARLAATSLILALLPLLGAVACVVWFALGRPVLFLQKRPGLEGRPPL